MWLDDVSTSNLVWNKTEKLKMHWCEYDIENTPVTIADRCVIPLTHIRGYVDDTAYTKLLLNNEYSMKREEWAMSFDRDEYVERRLHLVRDTYKNRSYFTRSDRLPIGTTVYKIRVYANYNIIRTDMGDYDIGHSTLFVHIHESTLRSLPERPSTNLFNSVVLSGKRRGVWDGDTPIHEISTTRIGILPSSPSHEQRSLKDYISLKNDGSIDMIDLNHFSHYCLKHHQEKRYSSVWDIFMNA